MSDGLFKKVLPMSACVVELPQPQSHIAGLEKETLNPQHLHSKTGLVLWIKSSFTAFLKPLFLVG
jgi:hypothetical protein